MDLKEMKKEAVMYGERTFSFYSIDTKVSLSDVIASGRTIPDLEFGQDEGSWFSRDENIIHIGLFGFLTYSNKKPMWTTEDEFHTHLQYLKGHEEQHFRSTTGRAWEWAMSEGRRTVIRELSNIYEPTPRRFMKDADYDYVLKSVLPQYLSINDNVIMKFVRFLANSIEDGRIERLRGKLRPGYKNLVKTIRGKLWKEEKIEPAPKSGPDDQLMIVMNQVLCLATMGIYQKGFISLYSDDPMYQLTESVKADVQAGVLSPTCKQGMQNTLIVIKKLVPLFGKSLEKNDDLEKLASRMQDIDQTGSGSPTDNEQYSASEKNEETGNADENEDTDKTDCGFNIFEDETSEKTEKSQSGEGVSSDLNSTSTSSDSSSDSDKAEGSSNSDKSSDENSENSKKSNSGGNASDGESGSKGQEITEDMEADEKAVIAAMKESAKSAKSMANAAIKGGNASGKKKKEDVEDNSTCPDVSDICTNFKEFKREYTVSEMLPPDIQMRGTVLHNKFKKYFNSLLTPNLRNRNSGSFDARSAYRLAMKTTDVFQRKSEGKPFDGCVEILVDNSGSMGTGRHSKRAFACTASAIVEEAFKDLVPVKIVAFDTSSGGMCHEVIKNWDDSFSKNCSWSFALHGRSGGGTPTANSLMVAKRELLQRPNEKKLLILLTDETASCSNNALPVIIKDIRKAGIQLCGIYFENVITEQNKRDFDKLFDGIDNISVTPDEIDGEMIRIIKKFTKV